MKTKDLGRRAHDMLDVLARFTAEPGRLTRPYLSTEHRQAADTVAVWMRDAGMSVRMDGLGTVHGRLSPPSDALPAGAPEKVFLIGSHLDTVVDAGRFDGMMGVVAGILAVEEIGNRSLSLPFAVDVLAFGDEEGLRFPSNLLSSSGVAGRFNPSDLTIVDKDGISIGEALEAFHRSGDGKGSEPPGLDDLAYDPSSVVGYLELHTEQGRILEEEGLALGIVTGITGSVRYRFVAEGMADHAGTTPMPDRRDAFMAAAELALAIEEIALARRDAAMVATLGTIGVEPGAINVIPGRATFTLDLRASSDTARGEAVEAIKTKAAVIGQRRGVSFDLDLIQEVRNTPCSPIFDTKIAAAFDRLGLPAFRLPSGAGHDGQAMVHLTDIGMIFTRCRAGISHAPEEFVEADDIALAVEAMIGTVEAFAADRRSA
ncbi:MAG: Zn-dependent hydrolase [Pseudomonadota bacterium]